jgi:hypothetical protein
MAASTVQISPGDVLVFLPGANEALVQAIIDGTMARARRLAPCLADESEDADFLAAAKDILVGIVVRAVEVSGGETVNIIAGPFQQGLDSSKRRATRFRPDEIRDLQALCGIRRGGAFTITLTHDDNDAFIEDVTVDDA